jgi:hypothetical protein
MGLIVILTIFVTLVAVLAARYTNKCAPTQNPCNQNCYQGRNCKCSIPDNTNWPFPTRDKP